VKLWSRQQLDRAYAFACSLLEQGAIDWQCEPWAEPRTSKQNRYLWRAVYEPLVERCGFSKEEWHEHWCIEYFGAVEVVKPSGKVEVKPQRTTTTNEHGKRDVLKGKAFADFVAFVESECAKRGVFVVEQWEEAA
jgi:hypothetical protein